MNIDGLAKIVEFAIIPDCPAPAHSLARPELDGAVLFEVSPMTDEYAEQLEIFETDSQFSASYAIQRRHDENRQAKVKDPDALWSTVKDLTGNRYGSLEVVYLTDERFNGKVVFVCRCDCGREIKATGMHLNRITSCGCYKGKPGTKGILGYKIAAPSSEMAFKQLYSRTRWGASDRGLAFSIPYADFKELSQSNCHYCGIEPRQVFLVRNRHECYYNGLDRVDSGDGYELENVVPCCGQCNMAKRAQTTDEFYDWLDRIAAYRNQAA